MADIVTATDAWVAWLESKVGIVEQPKGSNHTPIGVEYGWDHVAWCAETQSLAAYHTFGRKVLWTAGVADARARAKAGENDMQWLGKTSTVQVGDLPCFDWGGHGDPADMHISGIVNPATQDRFETIGGNEGDAVRRQWRDRRHVMGFIRLPFTSVGLGASPLEEDMGVITDPDQIKALTRIDDGIAALIDGMRKQDDRLAALEDKLKATDEQHLAEARRNLRDVAVAVGVPAPSIEGLDPAEAAKIPSIIDEITSAIGKG
jgi:hypothetical protein